MDHNAQSISEKLNHFLYPKSKLRHASWQHSYNLRERRKFKALSRFYFMSAALAYIGHFFFVDLRLEKTPLALWASYRFSLTLLCVFGLLLANHRRLMASRLHKWPVAIGGFAFSMMQAQTMLWQSDIPYFYAFLIPSVTAIILRVNIPLSLAYTGLVYLLQLPTFNAAGLGAHHMISASLMSVVGVVIFRANMLAEIDAFISEQLKDDMQCQLNSALSETRGKEKALAFSNHELTRKNKVFQTLLESATNLPHIRELKDLLVYTAEEFIELFPGAGVAVAIHGDSDELLGIASRGLPQDIEQYIVREKQRLASRSLQSELAHRLFSDEEHPYGTEAISSLPLLNAADERIGSTLLIGVELNQETLETASLLLALVTSCVENLLLTQKLEFLAHTDKLTATYNRNFFEKELDRRIHSSGEAAQQHLSLILVDVNGLKHINDHYGHEEGDKLIQEVAGLLKRTCRKTDLVCRLGGDEFVILCPETKNVDVLTARLRQGEIQSRLRFADAAGDPVVLPIRFSMGIASTAEVNARSLLKEADERMYSDKRQFYKVAAVKKTS